MARWTPETQDRGVVFASARQGEGQGQSEAKEASEPPSPYENPIFERIDFAADSSPVEGDVRWAPGKSLFYLGLLLFWGVAGSWYFSWSAVLVFVGLTALTLCFGHSLGMHRHLIHRAFDCPQWLSYVLIYLGTLVGMGGPFTMMRIHDLRDWAQRCPACHAFFSHDNSFWKDSLWQLHCDIRLKRPPVFRYPKELKNDRFFRILEATAPYQQIPLAVALWWIGDLGWVAWGVAGRVVVSLSGHWMVGYFAHRTGQRDWHLSGASTQGYNLRGLGLVTFGECWHNNHHAFPGSAQLGHKGGQSDPGWWMLKVMQRLGLVWNVQTPASMPPRENLTAIGGQGFGEGEGRGSAIG